MDQVMIESVQDKKSRIQTYLWGFLLIVAASALLTFYVVEWYDSIDPDIVLLPPIVAFLLLFAGAGMITVWVTARNCRILVKPDGVWGTTMGGKEVFLPANQITKLGKGDKIFSVSLGRYVFRFVFLGNVPALRAAIRELMTGNTGKPYRQNSLADPGVQRATRGVSAKTSGASPSRRKGSGAVARDLKRYKKLCDQGIITRDEFEAKKRQLLDL